MFGSNAPPILRGVTYVEHLPGVPGTVDTCQAYIDRVTAEVAGFIASRRMTHPRQQQILAIQRNNEIRQPRIQFNVFAGLGPPPRKTTMSPNISWIASGAMNPADKGQGVRAPRTDRY